MTEAEKSGVDNPYRYSTKEWDEKSGLYYFGARFYYPEVGRWTQRDPAGILDGLNLYAYAGNDPVGSIDADGRKKKIPWPRWLKPDLIKRINKAIRWAKNKDKFKNCLRLIEDRCYSGGDLDLCQGCCEEIWAYVDVVMKWKNDTARNPAHWKFREACYAACEAIPVGWPGKLLERPKE